MLLVNAARYACTLTFRIPMRRSRHHFYQRPLSICLCLCLSLSLSLPPPSIAISPPLMQLLPSPPLCFLRFFAVRRGKTLVTNARIISKYSFSVLGERTLTQVSSEEPEELERLASWTKRYEPCTRTCCGWRERSGPRSNGQKSRDFLAVVGLLRSENAPIRYRCWKDRRRRRRRRRKFFVANVLRYLCTGFREIWNKLRGKLRILACPDSDSFLPISFGAAREKGGVRGKLVRGKTRGTALCVDKNTVYGKLISVLSEKKLWLAPLNECNDSFEISDWMNKLSGKESFGKNAISLDDKRPKLLKPRG